MLKPELKLHYHTFGAPMMDGDYASTIARAPHLDQPLAASGK